MKIRSLYTIAAYALFLNQFLWGRFLLLFEDHRLHIIPQRITPIIEQPMFINSLQGGMTIKSSLNHSWILLHSFYLIKISNSLRLHPANEYHPTSRTRGKGVDSSLGTYMMCLSHYEIEPHIYKKFIDKNICIPTNGVLQNGVVYVLSISI